VASAGPRGEILDVERELAQALGRRVASLAQRLGQAT